MDRFKVSERRACRVLRQPRATQRYLPAVRDDEEPLTQRIIELAAVYGRYGTPRITSMLRDQGWRVNHKRVWRNCRFRVVGVWRKCLQYKDLQRVGARHPDTIWCYEHGRSVPAIAQSATASSYSPSSTGATHDRIHTWPRQG
ncbi:MAG: transposase [Phycisphaerales bacterium]|nr:MAG: transposase [Phycisphaerales bacterium]